MNFFGKRPIEECFEKTKKPAIKVKWVGRNRGDRQHMNVSLRLVGRTNQHRLCGYCYQQRSLGNKPKVLVLNDISRAFLHARTTSDRYAELCEEDRTEPGDEKQMREAYEVGVWDKGSST